MERIFFEQMSLQTYDNIALFFSTNKNFYLNFALNHFLFLQFNAINFEKCKGN